MAYLELYNWKTTSVDFAVELSSNFNQNFYKRVVISTGTVSEGSTSPPSGIRFSINAPSVSGSNYVLGTITGLSPDTYYNLHAYASVAYDGKWYHAGSDSGWTKEDSIPETGKARVVSTTASSITIEVYNLSYQARLYDFEVDVYKNNTNNYVKYHNWSTSSSGYSTQATITGLDSDSLYYFDVWVYRSGWTQLSSVYISGRTDSLVPSKPSHPPTLDQRTEGGFDVYWGSSSNVDFYTLRIRDGSTYSYEVTYNTSFSVTGLNYGTTYYLSVRGESYDGYSDYTNEYSCTVAPKTPRELVAYDITKNSVSIQVKQMTGNWDYVRVYREEYVNGNWVSRDYKDISYGYTTAHWVNLSNGSRQRFEARSFFTVSNTLLPSVRYSTYYQPWLVVQLELRPDNFQWTYPKISGQPFRLTASEWNNFTNRINEFRDYLDLSQVSFSTAITNNIIYASIFNQARSAISSMNSSGLPSAKSSNDKIYASDLNAIVSCLNNIS